VALVVFGEVVRHRRSTLQQRATADSHINNNAVEEIPKLTRRSGFDGTAIPLYFLNQSPGLNDNPTIHSTSAISKSAKVRGRQHFGSTRHSRALTLAEQIQQGIGQHTVLVL
jgi:hypothetical protein